MTRERSNKAILERTFEILRLLAANRDGMTIAEISDGLTASPRRLYDIMHILTELDIGVTRSREWRVFRYFGEKQIDLAPPVVRRQKYCGACKTPIQPDDYFCDDTCRQAAREAGDKRARERPQSTHYDEPEVPRGTWRWEHKPGRDSPI